jgi:hypothetical protein
VHRLRAREVATLGQAAEAHSARAVDDQRAGQFGDEILVGQVDLAITEQVAEEATDIAAQCLAPPHRMAHAADDEAPRRGREHVVREHAVGAIGIARKRDDRDILA